jgi:hypothetical protein
MRSGHSIGGTSRQRGNLQDRFSRRPEDTKILDVLDEWLRELRGFVIRSADTHAAMPLENMKSR